MKYLLLALIALVLPLSLMAQSLPNTHVRVTAIPRGAPGHYRIIIYCPPGELSHHAAKPDWMTCTGYAKWLETHAHCVISSDEESAKVADALAVKDAHELAYTRATLKIVGQSKQDTK